MHMLFMYILQYQCLLLSNVVSCRFYPNRVHGKHCHGLPQPAPDLGFSERWPPIGVGIKRKRGSPAKAFCLF